MKRKAYVLKIALFATGLSGIVSEYILATLATYFLGNSVLQWTLTISLMLFFMGVGARITKFVEKHLFTWFVAIELLLSFLVSFSAVSTYGLAGLNDFIVIWIYGLAILTGTLIGMELPLAVRLNEKFEVLKTNVSSILEKDYYGSLVGGLFFAFVGLPYLGLTYTPFILGGINLLVAIALLNFFPEIISKRRRLLLNIAAIITLGVVLLFLFNAPKIILYGQQKKYLDKVVYEEQTAYQKIVITQFKDNYWLYLNGNLQFSSFDEPLYHEVLVHPAMQLTKVAKEVLILGGGDGCAVRELLKYQGIEKITLVDLDPGMTALGKEHPIIRRINEEALDDPRVEVINIDAFRFLEKEMRFYDLIIVDLPDPRSVELSRLYAYEFYRLCYQHLRPQGALITQAGSPYFAPEAFKCIQETMKEAGFCVQPMHNQVVTMGEWGWVIGSKAIKEQAVLLKKLRAVDFSNVETQWINQEAMMMITSFGKGYFEGTKDSIKINYIEDPVLQRYYLNGSWEMY
ncbi:MAG: polyamine aminopropyltransferase [Bacteroidota bacterium]